MMIYAVITIVTTYEAIYILVQQNEFGILKEECVLECSFMSEVA